MLISVNRLKKYIKNNEQIDWMALWDLFTIRTAEVDAIHIKGNDISDVVVAEITSCVTHPTKEKYHILKVNDGTKEYNILCGAPNVRVGLKAPLVKIGGMVSGITITAKKIAGVDSEGMLCAMDELGIGESHEGIMELPSDFPLGKDIKELLPIEDIIVEIDNKSLTNRPDLWGIYGIAREVSAITKHDLLPLEILEVSNNQKDLDIRVKDTELCFRYCGITVDNLKNNKTPIDMQIFLHYSGMRSISLFVDISNFVMLELGQPNHTFDTRVVKNIIVDRAKNKDTFKTLDGITRPLTNDMLMIENDQEYFGIAGVMGGLESEIMSDTKSIFIESATFDATSVRKTATALGLRTEASARFEKSLDPNMAIIALKRILFLLKNNNPDMQITSNLTDIYPKPLTEQIVFLDKKRLNTYMNFEMKKEEVKEILESLYFKVEEETSRYKITVPTYRSTKDITMDADIIEELARIHGYENFAMIPLKLDLTFKELESTWNEEYKIKQFLASKYNIHEVNSYLWYETNLLNKTGVEKNGVTLLEKYENNILRDDLSFSLLPILRNNLKNHSEVNLFEIGTVIKENDDQRHLSIILSGDESSVEQNYYQMKQIINNLFKTFKGKEVFYEKEVPFDYYEKELSRTLIVDQQTIGYFGILNSKTTNYVGKKKGIVVAEIDFLKFVELPKIEVEYQNISKFPVVELDYTIITGKKEKYEIIDNLLQQFKSPIIKNYQLVDTFEDDIEKKYTIRYLIGSEDKTLDSKDLNDFKTKFIEYIKQNGLMIIE